MSHVTCHPSHVTCHVSPVTCHMSLFLYFSFLSSLIKLCRVCYQQGLTRLVWQQFFCDIFFTFLQLFWGDPAPPYRSVTTFVMWTCGGWGTEGEEGTWPRWDRRVYNCGLSDTAGSILCWGDSKSQVSEIYHTHWITGPLWYHSWSQYNAPLPIVFFSCPEQH